MEEIWKDIQGYEGLYQVSNLGNIKSLHYRARTGNPKSNIQYSRNMKLFIEKSGYVSIKLCKSGHSKRYLVHRIVANAFIPNPQSKPQINHKDGNKSNNTVNNLEWTTNSENQKHAVNLGLKEKNTVGQMGHKNVMAKPIIQYDLSGNFVKLWYSIADAARAVDGMSALIVHCAKGRIKHCYNSIWRYIENDYIPMQISVFNVEKFPRKA